MIHVTAVRFANGTKSIKKVAGDATVEDVREFLKGTEPHITAILIGVPSTHLKLAA